MGDEVVKRHVQRAAFFLHGGKPRGHGRHPLARGGQGLQPCIQRRRSLGAYHPKMGACVTQPLQHRLGHGHLGLQPTHVVGGFFASGQHHHLRGPLGHGRQPQVDTGAGGVPQRQRNHVGRHAVQALEPGFAAQLLYQLLALLLAVQQQHGVFATGFGVGAEQGFKTQPLLTHPRVGVTQRTRRAHRGAGPAAHTQVGVHGDFLACLVAADGLGRANVDTRVTPHLGVTAVGTQGLFVGEEFGFFELAHHLAQLQQRVRAVAVPAEVTLGRRV